MSLTTWHNPMKGGTRWRLTTEGIEVEGKGILRSPGEPVSMLRLWEDYGEYICAAGYELGAPVDVIAAMIPIEAVRIKGSLSFDPYSNRFEPGYINDEQTPHRRSPGLMQTLISTAAQMEKLYGVTGGREVTTELLFDPYYSIMLGTAYLHHKAKRYGWDPPLLCGAYNAGGVYKSGENEFKIRTYGPQRMPSYIKWFNDFHAALGFVEGGIELPKGVFTVADLI